MNIVLTPNQAKEFAEQLNHDFSGRLHAVSSGYGAIDLLQKGVHKAWGLDILLKHFGLESSGLLAFGDSENDYEMLALAGYAYAMENAEPVIKKLSPYQAPHHDQSGVLQIIEQYLEKGEIDGSTAT